MEKIFKDKKMAAVTNSMPGNVDTSDWFKSLSDTGRKKTRQKLYYE